MLRQHNNYPFPLLHNVVEVLDGDFVFKYSNNKRSNKKDECKYQLKTNRIKSAEKSVFANAIDFLVVCFVVCVVFGF